MGGKPSLAFRFARGFPPRFDLFNQPRCGGGFVTEFVVFGELENKPDGYFCAGSTASASACVYVAST